jgi:bacterioferritin-associated ferredoxin
VAVLICVCREIEAEQIRKSIDDGSSDITDLAINLDGVGTPCGFCHDSLRLLLTATRSGEQPSEVDAKLRTMWPYA